MSEPAPLILQTDVPAVSDTGRRSNDAYFTAPALAEALVSRLVADSFWRGGKVLEPSAGRGAFVRAIAAASPAPTAIFANDCDPVRVSELEQVEISSVYPNLGDFLDWGTAADLIIGNPPYSLAQKHTEHALSRRERFGAVAFLLRLGFLESEDRAPFWREHPASKIYVLSQRPSFTGGGTDNSAYGFFVWANWWHGPTVTEVISWREPAKRGGRRLDPNDVNAPHPPGITPPLIDPATGPGPLPGWTERHDLDEAAEAAP